MNSQTPDDIAVRPGAALFVLAVIPPAGCSSAAAQARFRGRVRAFYASESSRPAPNSARQDSGIDLRAPLDVVVAPGAVAEINFGVRAVCLRAAAAGSRATAFWLLPRSSISKTPLMMANAVGLIDVGYRGPLIATVRNLGPGPHTIRQGDALFQLASPGLEPAERWCLSPKDAEIEARLFSATERGAGGFGSTGRAGRETAMDASRAIPQKSEAAEGRGAREGGDSG